MGCTGEREKGPPEETAKWDYITLSDFRCTSGGTVAAYIWLWAMVIVGLAVYVADTYTAVNLLFFNKWSSQVKPALDFKYTRWIFAVCILISFALCAYEWLRALRVIKRGGVAESFLDPLAVDLQSIRPQGFKRFLVFTELANSKKGADYIALFVYFSFKGAVRVIVAQGPRQAVNAMTLYAVLGADIIPGENIDRSSFDQFWWNIEQLFKENAQQAVIYLAMLFTLVIWVISALSLIFSGIAYITFLWHYVPQRDGRLSVYCRRKVDRRLAKIVEHKVKAAIEEDERKKVKAEQKAELKRQKTGELPPPERPYLKKQPTLPSIGGTTPEAEKKDKLPDFPLVRHDTDASVATLPLYTSRPPTRNEQRQPTLPNIDVGRPGMPTRANTQASQWSEAPSYSTVAPLLANAGYAGGPEVAPPTSAFSRQDSNSSYRPLPARMDTQSSQGSRYIPRGATPGPRAQTPGSARPYSPANVPGYSRQPPAPRIPLPVRSNTAHGFDQDVYTLSNGSSSQGGFSQARPPPRSNTADGYRLQSNGPSATNLHSQQSFSRPVQARNGSQGSSYRSFTPGAPSVPEGRSTSPDSYEMQPQPTHNIPAESIKVQGSQYVAFNPAVHSATPPPAMHRATPPPALQEVPRRNITVAHGAPASGNGDYFGQVHHAPQRSATAPLVEAVTSPGSTASRHSDYAHDILDEYDSVGHTGPQRSGAAGPHGGYQAF